MRRVALVGFGFFGAASADQHTTVPASASTWIPDECTDSCEGSCVVSFRQAKAAHVDRQAEADGSTNIVVQKNVTAAVSHHTEDDWRDYATVEARRLLYSFEEDAEELLDQIRDHGVEPTQLSDIRGLKYEELADFEKAFLNGSTVVSEEEDFKSEGSEGGVVKFESRAGWRRKRSKRSRKTFANQRWPFKWPDQRDLPGPVVDLPPRGRGGGPDSSKCFGRVCSTRSICRPRSKELCFCQLARNEGCKQGCCCRQGCRGVTWQHEKTVVFKNMRRAGGCFPSIVLLTVPRSFVKDVHDLKRTGCPLETIRSMLHDSWSTWHGLVGKGAVQQCFHSSHAASVHYLHLQTFCSRGNFHGMPTRNRGFASCVTMHGAGDADRLAKTLLSKI